MFLCAGEVFEVFTVTCYWILRALVMQRLEILQTFLSDLFKTITDFFFTSCVPFLKSKCIHLAKIAFSLNKYFFIEKNPVEDQTGAFSEGIWKFICEENVEQVQTMITEWQELLRERGPVGEIPLHICFLLGSVRQLEMAWYMIKQDPEIVSLSYQGGWNPNTAPYLPSPYEGENILHIAIVNKRFDLVKKLVDGYPNYSKQLLCSRATGSFFQQGQACYFGEYPLFFAAATNQLDIFDFLLERGSDIAAKDSNGNTILHILVFHQLLKAYSYVERRWVEQHSHASPGSIQNKDKMTPFMLSAYLGNKDMFEFLLEKSKKVNWSYGPVTCFLFPLEQLDGNIASGDQSALQLIVDNSHFDLLTNSRVKALLERKWNSFAFVTLSQRLALVVLYLFVLSCFLIHRQVIVVHTKKTELCVNQAVEGFGQSKCLSMCLADLDQQTYGTYFVSFTFVVVGAIWKGSREVAEIKKAGLLNYSSSRGSAFLENFLSFCYCVCLFFFCLLHWAGSSWESLFLGLASMCAFSYLFFFLLAFRITGPMVVMIHKMLLNDVLRFFLVYVVFLLAFSHTFMVLDHHQSAGIFGNLASLFDATLGEFDISASWTGGKPNPSVSVGLLVVFVVLVSIQLINLLIAMMGDTYSQVNEDAEKQWQLERARIIFSLENEMTNVERKNLNYAVVIGGVRYFQVEAVNTSHYNDRPEQADN